jgi:hypothetical protein
MAKMNLENFLTMCENAKDLEDVEYVLNKKKKTTRVKNKTKMTPMLDALSDTLLKDFSEFFDNLFVESSTYVAEDLFARNEADSIAKNLDQITTPSSIAMYIGGKRILGQLEMLHSSVLKFRQGEIYRSYLSDLLSYNNRVVSEKERLENEMEQKQRNRLMQNIEGSRLLRKERLLSKRSNKRLTIRLIRRKWTVEKKKG